MFTCSLLYGSSLAGPHLSATRKQVDNISSEELEEGEQQFPSAKTLLSTKGRPQKSVPLSLWGSSSLMTEISGFAFFYCSQLMNFDLWK